MKSLRKLFKEKLVPELISLYQTGGIVLVFIGFQIWLIRYFMKQVSDFSEERKKMQDVFDEALGNHCNTVSSTLNTLSNSFMLLCSKIDNLIEKLDR